MSMGVQEGLKEAKWGKVGKRGTKRSQVGSGWQYGEMFGVWVGKSKTVGERLGKRLIEMFVRDWIRSCEK